MSLEDSVKSVKRAQTPTRFRKANSNARLGSLQETVEDMLGLPAGSIHFVRPDGRRVRSDATVATLRAYWDE